MAIFTSSVTSGALALRHELGHIFADVGEEYDGGNDYSGPNFAETARVCAPGELPRRVPTSDGVREVWPCVSWGAWLPPASTAAVAATAGSSSSSSRSRSSRSALLVQASPGSMPLAAWPFALLTAGGEVLALPLRSARVLPELRGTRVLVSVAGVTAAPAGAAEAAAAGVSIRAGAAVATVDSSAGSHRADEPDELPGPPWPPVGYGVDAFGMAARFELTLGGTTVILPPAPSLDRTFYTFTVPALRVPGQPSGASPLLPGGEKYRGSPAKGSVSAPLSLVVALTRPPAVLAPPGASVGTFPSAAGEAADDNDDAAVAAAGLPQPMLCHAQVHQYPTAQHATRAAEDPRVTHAPAADAPSAAALSLSPSPSAFSTSSGSSSPPFAAASFLAASFAAVPAADAVGAFPVFGARGDLKGFRPTQEGCLMRDMRQTCFCAVCLERLWRKVLPRAGLLRTCPTPPPGLARATPPPRPAVERADAEATAAKAPAPLFGPIAVEIAPGAATATLSVQPAPLGAFSEPAYGSGSRRGGGFGGSSSSSRSGREEDEALEVRWYRVALNEPTASRSGDGRRRGERAAAEEEAVEVSSGDSRRLTVPVPLLAAGDSGAAGCCYRARARFVTGRVRSEPRVFEEAAFALLVATDTSSPGSRGSSTGAGSAEPLLVITALWQALPETAAGRDLGALVRACAGDVATAAYDAAPAESAPQQLEGWRQARWLTSAEAGLSLPYPSHRKGPAAFRLLASALVTLVGVLTVAIALMCAFSRNRKRSNKTVQLFLNCQQVSYSCED